MDWTFVLSPSGDQAGAAGLGSAVFDDTEPATLRLTTELVAAKHVER